MDAYDCVAGISGCRDAYGQLSGIGAWVYEACDTYSGDVAGCGGCAAAGYDTADLRNCYCFCHWVMRTPEEDVILTADTGTPTPAVGLDPVHAREVARRILALANEIDDESRAQSRSV